MDTTRKLKARLVIAMAFMLVLAACGGNPDATETEQAVGQETADGTETDQATGPADSGEEFDGETIQLSGGLIAAPHRLPVYMGFYGAEDGGYFEEVGVEMDYVGFGKDSDCTRAMVAGDLDFCVIGADTAVRVAQPGSADVRIIGTVADPTINTLGAQPEIESFEDLRGASIAVGDLEAGSTVAVLALLDAHGITVDDIDPLVIGSSSDRFTALTSGEVDAAVLSQPGDFIAEDEGYTILGRSSDERPTAAWLTAIPGQSDETDEGLTRLVHALELNMQRLADPENEASVTEELVEVYGLEDDHAQRFYDLFIGELEWASTVEPEIASVERTLDLTHDFTSTDVIMPAEELYDDRYVTNMRQRIDQ